MGSEATVIVVGGAPGLAHQAQERLADLESLWSRFQPTSEIRLLNDAAGEAMTVSGETILLVTTALEAWGVTGGSYDPTVLGDVLRAGYTVSFEQFPPLPQLSQTQLKIGAGGIRVDPVAQTVQLPKGVGFDPGGIGKGLAADMVAAELMAGGVAGACVNVGGDLRVCGQAPDDSPDAGWPIGVENPFSEQPAALLGLHDGGVATSSRLHRRWAGPGGPGAKPSHHLIDPRTGKPADSGLATVTVVAAHAWQAEMLAKAVFLAGPTAGSVLLDRVGAAGLLITDKEAVLTTVNLAPFLANASGQEAMSEVGR